MASAELAVVPEPSPAPPVPALLEIDSWTAVAGKIIKLAEEIADTPFVPDGLRGSVPATAAAMLAGRELGLGPMTSLANIHVIKGKPGLSAGLMRALILAQGHQIETVDITDTRAVVRGRRKGEASWEEAAFTADQAKRAHIDLGGYPQDKLYARATSRLARRKFADVIAGMPYSAEELEDGEVQGDVPAAAAEQNGNGQQAPKPAAQKARRKTAAAGDDTQGQRPGADDSTAREPAPRAAGAAPSRDAQQLPPLPGEDEEPPGPTSPPAANSGTPATSESAQPATPTSSDPDRHRKLVGVVRAHFKRLGYTDGEDQLRLEHTAVLAGTSEIGSTNDLDEDELSAVADTLARCKNIDALKVLLDAAQKAKAGDGDE
jgi:hypothetical protein